MSDERKGAVLALFVIALVVNAYADAIHDGIGHWLARISQ